MNLIICTTPFQVLLAEKIFNKRPNEEYIFRYISINKSDKTEYYYRRLADKINNSEFIHADFKNGVELIVFCIKEKIKSILNNEYSKVNRIILGSIDNNHIHIHIHIHNIIHNNKNVVIETFDDGTANLYKESFFYQDTPFSRKMRVLRWFLCRGTDMALLKRMDVKHYSVYKNRENIINNVEYLPLFSYENKIGNSSANNHIERLFLGQPIYEMDTTRTYDKAKHKHLIIKLAQSLEIDYFIPHPREEYYLELEDKYIDTPMIFEDYFFNKYDSNVKYKVYTFFSGAVLSLTSLPNVEVVLIRISNFPIDLDKIYTMMMGFGLPVIEEKL